MQYKLQLLFLFNTAFTFQRQSLLRDPLKTTLMFDIVEAKDLREYTVSININTLETTVIVNFNYWTNQLS